MKKVIFYLIPSFAIFTIIQFIRSSTDLMDSYSISVEYIVIITLCLFYFSEEINNPKIAFIYSHYTFWLVVGILIYATGTFFLFLFGNDFTYEEWKKWAPINHFFTILKNLFFSIAIIVNSRPPKDLSSGLMESEGYQKPYIS